MKKSMMQQIIAVRALGNVMNKFIARNIGQNTWKVERKLGGQNRTGIESFIFTSAKFLTTPVNSFHLEGKLVIVLYLHIKLRIF